MTTINSFLKHTSTDVFRTAGLGTQKPIANVDFLTHIPSPLASFVQSLLLPLPSSLSLSSSSKDGNSNGPDKNISSLVSHRVDQFDLSIRQHLLSLCNTVLQSNQDSDAAIVEETIEEILSFARNVIDVTLHFLHQYCAYSLRIPSMNTKHEHDIQNDDIHNNEQTKLLYGLILKTDRFRALSFVLLDDLVDSLPTQTLHIFWNHGPDKWLNELLCKLPPSLRNNSQMRQFIHDENLDLLTKGKFIILQFSRKMLNQLSVASSNLQAQFAGQVTMTLASILPMDDKSGTNNLGVCNTESIVEYESLNDWFTSNNQSKMDHKSKNKGTRSRNAAGVQSTLNYNFYESFWELQRDFTESDLLIFNEKKGDALNDRWNRQVVSFIKRTQTVLGAFEGNEFPTRLVKEMKKRWNDANKRPVSGHSTVQDSSTTTMDIDTNEKEKKDNNDNNNNIITKKKSNRQYKYMTNSQLLHLQLQDPEIRMHILTQILIITSFIIKSLKSNIKVNPMSAGRVCEDLSVIESRAGEILKSTPPNGEKQYTTLKWVLQERETIWRNWKNDKCQSQIEQHHQVPEEKSNESAEDLAKKRRRSLMSGTLGGDGSSDKGKGGKSALASLADLYSYKINVKTELPDISMSTTKKHKPNMFDYLQEYVDALDPESGIEEIYHPKSDKVFAWRAMRLLNQKHVGRLGIDKDKHSMINLSNGDFEGLVRKIWKEEKGIDIPGEMPVADEIIEEQDEDEKEEEKSKKMDESQDRLDGKESEETEKEPAQPVSILNEESKMDVDEPKDDEKKQQTQTSTEIQQNNLGGQKRKRDDDKEDLASEKREKTEDKIKEEPKAHVESKPTEISSPITAETSSTVTSNEKHDDKENSPKQSTGANSTSTVPIKSEHDGKDSTSQSKEAGSSNDAQIKAAGGEKNPAKDKENKSIESATMKNKLEPNMQKSSLTAPSTRVENKANIQKGSYQADKTQQVQNQQQKSQPANTGRQTRSRAGPSNHGPGDGRQQRPNQISPNQNRRNDDRRVGGYQNHPPPQGRGGAGNLSRNLPNDHHLRGHPHPPNQQNHDGRQNRMNRRGDGGRRFDNPTQAGRFRDDRGRRGNQGASGGGPQRRGGGRR